MVASQLALKFSRVLILSNIALQLRPCINFQEQCISTISAILFDLGIRLRCYRMHWKDNENTCTNMRVLIGFDYKLE